MIEEVGQHS